MGENLDKNDGSVCAIDVSYVARLARLALADDEAGAFQDQLDHVLGYVKKISSLDLSGVEPMIHPGASVNVFRDDCAVAGLTAEQALSNAPETIEGQFKVPRIVE